MKKYILGLMFLLFGFTLARPMRMSIDETVERLRANDTTLT